MASVINVLRLQKKFSPPCFYEYFFYVDAGNKEKIGQSSCIQFQVSHFAETILFGVLWDTNGNYKLTNF